VTETIDPAVVTVTVTATPQKRHRKRQLPTLPFWPKHEMELKESIELDPANISIVPDTFREDQMSVFDEWDVAAAMLF
jgi:hypothetical protein